MQWEGRIKKAGRGAEERGRGGKQREAGPRCVWLWDSQPQVSQNSLTTAVGGLVSSGLSDGPESC